MSDECLVCGAPLYYTQHDRTAVCEICHNTAHTKTLCENGHYICDRCHTSGLEDIKDLCLSLTQTDPVELLQILMRCRNHSYPKPTIPKTG